MIISINKTTTNTIFWLQLVHQDDVQNTSSGSYRTRSLSYPTKVWVIKYKYTNLIIDPIKIRSVGHGEKRINRDFYPKIHNNSSERPSNSFIIWLLMHEFQDNWRTIYKVTFERHDDYTTNFISGDGSTRIKF